MIHRVAFPSGQRLPILAVSLGLLCAVGLLPLLRGGAARAQEQNPPGASSAAAIVNDLDDIDRLRVLNPLKLTSDQMDKLIAALTAAQADYDKKVNALGATLLAPNAEEVRTTKRQVLGGAPVPKEFDDKIKKLQSDFLKQRDGLNAENIQRVSGVCKVILTEKQTAEATKQERDVWEAAHPNTKKSSDAQLFNLFVVDTFISYPRIVPLLKEMKAAGS